MKRFFAYLLQFLAIASACLLLATMIWIRFSTDHETAQWLNIVLTINCFVEPTLCILALAALGDIKKGDRNRKTKQAINGDGNYQVVRIVSDDEQETESNGN